MKSLNEGPFNYEMDEHGKVYLTGYDRSQNTEKFWAQGSPANVTLATESKQLDKCFEYLAKAKRHYPFVCYEADKDLVAIRCWHNKYPENAYAIIWGQIRTEKLNITILDEQISEVVDGFKVEYWDDDSDNDRVLGRFRETEFYKTVLLVIRELVLVDFENKDFL